jgi:predicted  nucleic acid-binding Zn ribbon protein
MFVAEISWQIPASSTPDRLDEISYSLLAYLRKNGQIINSGWPISRSGDRLKTVVMMLEADSLDLKYANKYVLGEIDRAIEWEFGAPKIELIGESPGFSAGTTCICKSSSCYILYTHYLEIGSSVKCGDCFAHIPLYHLPKTYDGDEYYDLLCWERDYQACDILQMNCKTGERFGIQQMSDPHRSLAKQGREICDRLTQLTGKPTYYALWRYKVRTSLKREKQRRCPSCDGEWFVKDKWLRFDFKCDRCRLVSEISCTVT